MKSLMMNTRGIRRLGSAATDLCYVACGKFEAFWEYGLHPWDIAAGIILVREAGGQASDFRGNETNYSGNEFIASNRSVHSEISKIISSFMHK